MQKMNNRNELGLLAVFEAVAETRSITRAAERLALSQPAVSHALNRLRDRIGDPLFLRGRDGLLPTPRAVAMMEPVRDILRAADTIFADGSYNPLEDPRTFRLAASEYSIATLIPRIIPMLRNRAPKAILEVMPFGGTTLGEMETGAVDCSFWGSAVPPAPWQTRSLFREQLIGVVGETHPLADKARRGQVTLDDYLAYPHIVVSMKEPGRSQIDVALEEIGRTRNVTVSTHSFSANIASLLASDLISSLPSRLVSNARDRGLVGFELPLAVPRFSYCLAWHRRTEADPALIWFRGMIFELAQETAVDSVARLFEQGKMSSDA